MAKANKDKKAEAPKGYMSRQRAEDALRSGSIVYQGRHYATIESLPDGIIIDDEPEPQSPAGESNTPPVEPEGNPEGDGK